jgi:hypothetical protein
MFNFSLLLSRTKSGLEAQGSQQDIGKCEMCPAEDCGQLGIRKSLVFFASAIQTPQNSSFD